MIDRVLRPNRGVVLMPLVDIDGVPNIVGPDGTTVPFTAPTVAVLDAWRAVVSANDPAAPFGGNISAATMDDLNLGLAASATNNDLVITSVGNEVYATFRNVDGVFHVLRDANKADTGVYNLATGLLNAPDSRYAVLDRIGYPADAPIAAGQVISIYELLTDNPVDQKADRANLRIEQTMIPTGLVLDQYTIAA